MNETIKNEAVTLTPLAVKVNERLRILCITKQMIGVEYHCSRSMISQYVQKQSRDSREDPDTVFGRHRG